MKETTTERGINHTALPEPDKIRSLLEQIAIAKAKAEKEHHRACAKYDSEDVGYHSGVKAGLQLAESFVRHTFDDWTTHSPLDEKNAAGRLGQRYGSRRCGE